MAERTSDNSKNEKQSLKVPSQKASVSATTELTTTSSTSGSAASSLGLPVGESSKIVGSDQDVKSSVIKKRFLGLKMPEKEETEELSEEDFEKERLEVLNLRAKVYSGLILFIALIAMIIMQATIFIDLLSLKGDTEILDSRISEISQDIGTYRLGISLEADNFKDGRVFCDEISGSLDLDFRRCYVLRSHTSKKTPEEQKEACNNEGLKQFYPKSNAEVNNIFDILDPEHSGQTFFAGFVRNGGQFVTLEEEISHSILGIRATGTAQSGNGALCMRQEGTLRVITEVYGCDTGNKKYYICHLDI